MTIELASTPKGKDFEDYISAFFQGAGYYIEKNISEENILELDVIVTDYYQHVPVQCLVEVKSGKWGFHDVFKVKGWMVYLNIDFGYFITQSDIQQFQKDKAAELNVNLMSSIVVDDIKLQLCEKMSCKTFDENEVDAWRYSYWVERLLLDTLIHKKKSVVSAKRYHAMLDYYNTINHDIFFSHCVLDKIEALYASFQNYPNLSAKVANEVLGNDFEEEYSDIPYDMYKKAFYDCEDTDLSLSSFIETKSRLALVKSAVDYILFKKAGVAEKVNKTLEFSVGKCIFQIDLFENLPKTFRDGLQELETHSYLNRYPIFWQYFLWLMGGFILNDYRDKEVGYLSEKSGIPISEVENAFKVFDILFPTPGGWFKNLAPNSNVTIMTHFPIPFYGLGANWRRYLHTTTHNINDLVLTGTYTKTDLYKWIGAGYSVLSKDTKVK